MSSKIKTKRERVKFASDNVAGACPEVLDAIIKANEGDSTPYGNDEWSTNLQNKFSETFSLGLRPEMFIASSGSDDATVSAFTLTGNLSLTDTLKIISEFRYDTSDDMIIPGFPTDKNMSGATIAAVYSF